MRADEVEDAGETAGVAGSVVAVAGRPCRTTPDADPFAIIGDWSLLVDGFTAALAGRITTSAISVGRSSRRASTLHTPPPPTSASSSSSQRRTVTGSLSTPAEDIQVAHCSGHSSTRIIIPEPRRCQRVTVYHLLGGRATFFVTAPP